jgi:thioredoxin-related protein
LALLAHQTILFNNPAYNHFFTKFFDKYAIEFNNGKEFNEIIRLINTGLPINLLFDKLGKDPILVEEKLRELVLLSSLKQLYYSKDIQQSSVNEIINYLSLHSKFELNRNIAKNLSHSLGRFNKGNPLPEISLSDFQNIHHTIDNFAGKKLYIMFLSDQCETCEADLKILKTLNHEFSQIQFLTILVGYSKSNALNWAQNLNLPWKVLWFNDDYGMLNDYRIKNFPVYFVADSNGNLLNAFPPSPRENLKSYFQYLNEGKKQKSGTEPTEFFQKN